MAISLTGLGVNVDRLFHGQAGPTATPVYTAPGAGRARTAISGREICNPNLNTDLNVRMGLIPQGGTSDGTHFLLNQTIKAGSTLLIDTSLILRAGDALEVYSDPLPAPTGLAALGQSTGGTLAAGSYYYKLTAYNTLGETLASAEVSATTTGTTGSVLFNWNRIFGATGYKLYRGTTPGGENALVATISSAATTTVTDTGAAGSAATSPTTATAGGCVFTISGSELPA